MSNEAVHPEHRTRGDEGVAATRIAVPPAPTACPKCGAAIPTASAEGLCPRCLLATATVATEAGQPSGTHASAPSLERVAAAFPQLEIIELIGVGGMGAVFKARQPKLDRHIALKILPETLAQNPAFAERFQREGRVLARLNHPNIVTVHDFGLAGGFGYLMMEYVDGVNLRQAMRAGRFTAAQALALVPRICEALQYAHDEGVLHRDIKPENILLDARGRVKIADFGIAKLMGESHAEVNLTATGAAVGTPQYMAPEQIERPEAVDHRADIYSLGVVFYELLTGELPLGRFAPPSTKADLDARIDEIVLRALTKERELRQQSAREVKTEVESLGNATRPNAASTDNAPATPLPLAPIWQLPLLARQTIRAVLLLFLALFVFAVGKEWSAWQSLVVSMFTRNGIQAACASVGIALALWGSVAWWRRRAAWALPLPLPPTPTPTDSWLRGVFAALAIAVAFNFARSVVVQLGLLGQTLGSPVRSFQMFVPMLIVALLLAWLLWRESRRTHLATPKPCPAWAQRVAIGLLFAAIASSISVLTSNGGGHVTLMGYGEWLALPALALWTGNRLWRAAAMALNSLALLGLPGLAWYLVQGLRGTLPPMDIGNENPWLQWLSAHPIQVVTLQMLSMLAVVAIYATLLHPAVRPVFGLPPRGRRHGGITAPPTDAPETLVPTLPAYQLPLQSRVGLCGVLLLFLGYVAYGTVVLWMPLRGLLYLLPKETWAQALIASIGIVAIPWLAIWCWRKRDAWLNSFRLPANADRTNRWLHVLFLAGSASAALDYVRILLFQAVYAKEALATGQMSQTTYSCITVLLLILPLAWLTRRELRRAPLIPPAPLPIWAHRVAIGLILVGSATIVSPLVTFSHAGRSSFAFTQFLMLAALAIWTGSRFWRAVALALNLRMLVELPLLIWQLVQILRNKVVFPDVIGESMLAKYPAFQVSCWLASSLAFVAVYATLLHPAVRSVFGLPPRGRSESRVAAPTSAVIA